MHLGHAPERRPGELAGGKLAPVPEHGLNSLRPLAKVPDQPPGGSPLPVPDLEATWLAMREELRERVGDLDCRTWLEPLTPVARRGGRLLLSGPAPVRSWVHERYLSALREAAGHVDRDLVSVELIEPGTEDGSRAPEARACSTMNPRYCFDQFVIGDENRLGHAAALATAEMPGQAYNPLFIHGPCGHGKTHLLHAIGNFVELHGGGLTARYATAESFTESFVQAIRGNEVRPFHDRFRGVDVLLLDDVQFLAAKSKTQQELFHTFDAMYESGRQVVFASDCPPAEMHGFEARLLERFHRGLVAEIAPLSAPARLAILKKRAELDAVGNVPVETLEEIARLASPSVRTLEAALIRVVALASLRSEEPTPELARALLTRVHEPSTRGCSLTDIQEQTAGEFGLTRARMLARDRTPKVALARQIAMYLARELTDEPLPAIGRDFGGRNHSTVLHAHRKVGTLLGLDRKVQSRVEGLRQRLAP